MSRLRGSQTIKDGSKTVTPSSYPREHFHDEQEDRPAFASYKNGSNRYHFGMTRQRNDEPSNNGRNCTGHANEDPDLLYKKSKQHFGAWDIKDIVQEEGYRSKKQTDRFAEDPRLTNGRATNEPARQDRYEDHEEALSRDDRGRTGSIDREQTGSHRSRLPRTKNESKEESQNRDEREQLLRDIENLNVEEKSPDRGIRAMIERFKSREEEKLKSRQECNSLCPEREEYRSKNGGRGIDRIDVNDRDRERMQKEDREDERRSGRPKPRELERFGQEESARSRSTDRRAEKFNDAYTDKKIASYGEEKSHRRHREVEDDATWRKDSPKRRSYVYDGNPEDFDVRLQRYERALVEPRRDPEPRRVSLKDSNADLGRKESFKQHDRQVTRKSSFKTGGDAKKSHSRDRESSLGRKTSFKDQENDLYRKNSFHSQEVDKKYFGSDPEHVSRKSSFKDQGYAGRKNPSKEQSSDYGRISSRNRNDEEERKRSLKGHTDGVSRITFKEHDADSTRIHSYKDQESDVGRVSFKDHTCDVGRKNSFKEKIVEFGGISYKDHEDDAEQKSGYNVQDNGPSKVSFRGFDEPRRRRSPNSRYVEFASVSVQCQEDEGRGSPPTNDQDYDSERKGTFKERDSLSKRRGSPRSKSYEVEDKRAGRHSRPLTPPKREEPECREEPKDREEFDSKSWHENNRIFAVKYLRENTRYRTNPEGRSEIERDPSPEMGMVEYGGRKHSNEGFGNEIEDAKQSCAKPEPYNYGSGDHVRDRNGATIIRIRSSPETAVERRRRRRPVQDVHAGRRRRYEPEDEEESDEDEEDDHRQRGGSRGDGFAPGRGVPTPSRRVWNYREGGVQITDVEEGQPCLQCGDTCTGFSPHTWRKNCTSCKCPREAHDVCHEEWVSVRSRLGLKGDESSCSTPFDPRAKGLAWAPPGLPAHKVEEYFSMLPEISVPRLGTSGERYRDRQLAIQLPKQDLARAYCRHLNPKHASSADDFMAARNEIALDIGSVQEVLERDLDCGGCHAPLKEGTLAVSASKLGLLYHPYCFRCMECKELLVDLAYCVHDDTLFCERHYAEQLKPRCAACDELIFSGEYTKAMNKDWHSGHFCCWQCDESLTGQRYVLRDEHPYCIKCYESVFANGCEECNKIIGIDSKDLSYKDKHWHEACFLCNRCRVSLVDKQFGSKVDKIYCGNCYDAQFASRCDGCGEIFRAGTKKMEYKTRQWHEKCFCCVVCKNPIGTKSFIPREQEIYCAGCYEDKFATRCVKCNKIITSGGVTYKNEPWHRDCFTCSNCNNSLAGQRFTSRDDKPYCADCFGELFAKRCTACSKPITGIGGTRFISFEDRHWHNDCFICAGCKTSLVGRGFITDGEDIICPDCAKMKLM
ncbi:four and a half LIM domains protein limpet isoform X9 [Xylocopa sonorina]|uniref:four and a half LIM domains protein limpet isoform X9 n=1 Tax=Xylocopa sonorina TaxID=1818115 RepID=UPI00403AB889